MRAAEKATMRGDEVTCDTLNEQSVFAAQMRSRPRQNSASRREEPKKNKRDDGADVLYSQLEIPAIDRSVRQRSAKTPAEDPHSKKLSPSCLRRRQKKAKSRADILNAQDGQEFNIIQRLDFVGYSSDEDEDSCGNLGKENSLNVTNEPDKKTPPMILKRTVSKSFEISAASKRKQVPKSTHKKLGAISLKGKNASSTPGDQLKSSEFAKAHIRNACLLHSPADKPNQSTKDDTRSGKRARNTSTGKTSNKKKAAKTPSAIITFKLCSLQRMFGSE